MIDQTNIAVVGAHLTGQPLNHQLTDLGATLVQSCFTAPCYRLYALAGQIPKPGLIRQVTGGYSIELEIWQISIAGFGQFITQIPAPLGIGTLLIEDNTTVQGFICEPYAIANAPEISHLGGWRAYLAQQQRLQ
jgi:allophanate hydrolase